MIRILWTLPKSLHRLSISLFNLYLYDSGVSSPILHSWDHIGPSIWRKMNYHVPFLCFVNHLEFVSDVRQIPRRFFFLWMKSFSHSGSTVALFSFSNVSALLEASELVCARYPMNSFSSKWSSFLGSTLSICNLFLCFHRFCLWRVSPCFLPFMLLQGIPGASGSSNFLSASLMISLYSSSFSAMKQIPRSFRAFSSFVFHSPQLLLLFQVCSLTYFSDLNWSGLDVACRLVISADHMYPSGGFSFNEVSVNPVHESDKSLDPSMFQ